MTPELWDQIEKGGMIFLLCLNIYLLLHGDLFSKAAVEKMLRHGNEQAKIMATEITTKMAEITTKAVAAGVMEAVTKIREMAPVTKELRKQLNKKQE